jgi:hypothetical protein
MKYFTPERLAHLQDHSDEGQFLAALDEWESVLQEYWQQLNEIQQRLRVIQPPLPKKLKEFLNYFTTMSLHDARVVDMYSGSRSRFRITLHPEFQPECLLVLTYYLDEPPLILADVLPEQLRSEPVSWLYDEVTLEDNKSRGEPVFHHSILLSDGREVGLCFRDVTMERPTPLVPAVSEDRGSP